MTPDHPRTPRDPSRPHGVTRHVSKGHAYDIQEALKRLIATKASSASDERAKQRVNAERASGAGKAGQ